jgi:hypothetical protein
MWVRNLLAVAVPNRLRTIQSAKRILIVPAEGADEASKPGKDADKGNDLEAAAKFDRKGEITWKQWTKFKENATSIGVAVTLTSAICFTIGYAIHSTNKLKADVFRLEKLIEEKMFLIDEKEKFFENEMQEREKPIGSSVASIGALVKAEMEESEKRTFEKLVTYWNILTCSRK